MPAEAVTDYKVEPGKCRTLPYLTSALASLFSQFIWGLEIHKTAAAAKEALLQSEWCIAEIYSARMFC